MFTLHAVRGQSKVMETSGDILLFSLPTASLVGTWVAQDKEGRWQFVKGFVFNQAVTLGMKYAINKPRPYGNGSYAFPSGHTSTTFQSTAFLQKRYGWSVGVPAYALATLTGVSRIAAHKHDGWDVLAGALVGVASSYLFTTPKGRDLELVFSSDAQNVLLGLHYTF
ncbi:phosphatase PAP2 family protein [Allomuricauda sp. NBRC 101325]|uniref:phosphatase PAP2 family protein n=1 Tax=Allomuricauda sp. NBRC 101325 TaxID=1113758 RepID=UPI0024A01C86|nr:phosphatase PAP2 family protein [Muricauda sp. NBRC 101325]GLU45168.1 hypothetical protein Musp01_27920 [Muricauda sp. NBRC 101325]